MSLNLNLGGFSGNPFEEVPNNRPNLSRNDGNAILYLFKPYANQFRDVGLRPFGYRFDENFTSTAQELIEVTKRGSVSHGAVISDLMNRTNLNDHMMPSYAAEMEFKSSRLSDNYRFILILTESGSSLISGNTIGGTGASNQIRRIYTGYFLDEPFNPTTFTDTRRTPNPNAFMVITHKTKIGSKIDHGPLGSVQKINHLGSENIANREVANSLIGHNGSGRFDNSLFLMTPENCINSVAMTDDGFSYAVPGASMDRGANIINNILEQPSHNVSQVVRGLVKFQDDILHKGELSSYKTDRFFDDTFVDETFTRNKFARHLALPRMSLGSVFDLDVDSKISICDLDKLVNGSLQVIPFENERPMYYETADQMETSMTNMYSFLIASVISPILNSAGLNEMQFEYQIADMGGLVQDDFRTFGGAPSWPMANEDLMRKVKAVEYELVNGVFKTIYESKGAFHVLVNANATGMTTVRLSLVGQGHRNPVDFEFPSCLGGLISPLIGNASANATNAEAIEGLFSHVTGIRNVTESFNSDDTAFLDFANSKPYNDGLGLSYE